MTHLTAADSTPGNNTSDDLPGSKAEFVLMLVFVAFATLAPFYISTTDSAPQALYEQNRSDPLVFRAAGELLREGQSPYRLENQLQNIKHNRLEGAQPPYAIPFSYPPNALPLFQLRAIGEPELNAALHLSVTVLLSLLCLVQLIYRYVDNPMTRLVMIVSATFWTPAMLDMVLAQTGHLLAWLVFAYVLAYHRIPVLAGIALGLLAFKPQYAIPLGLVALSRQSWPLLWAAAATFFATCLLSGLLYGWGMWPEFWISASSLNTTLSQMESWPGIAALLMPDKMTAISGLVLPVYGLGMLALGAALLRSGTNIPLLGATSLALLVTVILSPNTHLYDLQFLFVPAIYVTRHFSMKMWFMVILFLATLMANVLPIFSLLRFCVLVACLPVLFWIISVQTAAPDDRKPQRAD